MTRTRMKGFSFQETQLTTVTSDEILSSLQVWSKTRDEGNTTQIWFSFRVPYFDDETPDKSMKKVDLRTFPK